MYHAPPSLDPHNHDTRSGPRLPRLRRSASLSSLDLRPVEIDRPAIRSSSRPPLPTASSPTAPRRSRFWGRRTDHARMFGCPGEVNTAVSSFTLSALHPLRRRSIEPNTPTKDPLHTTTPPPTSHNSGALLLSSSYLLVHLVIPRMRTINMDTAENTNYRSGLRPPRVHATNTSMATTLQEITNSENNARAQATAIPTKRQYNGHLPQPEPKRKTLAEAAVEYSSKSQLPSAAPSVSARFGVRPTSIANLATVCPPSSNHFSLRVPLSRSASPTRYYTTTAKLVVQWVSARKKRATSPNQIGRCASGVAVQNHIYVTVRGAIVITVGLVGTGSAM